MFLLHCRKQQQDQQQEENSMNISRYNNDQSHKMSSTT